jgi:hypothetical protein
MLRRLANPKKIVFCPYCKDVTPVATDRTASRVPAPRVFEPIRLVRGDRAGRPANPLWDVHAYQQTQKIHRLAKGLQALMSEMTTSRSIAAERAAAQTDVCGRRWPSRMAC